MKANSSNGRGWQYKTIEVEVLDHSLTIGVSTDSTFTAGKTDINGNECVPFTGTWVSADTWQLTLKTPGDNAGWSPVTAIDSVAAGRKQTSVRMYNLAGQMVDDSFKGIVIQNGKKYLKK